jgi:hypothetical protein
LLFLLFLEIFLDLVISYQDTFHQFLKEIMVQF